MKTNYIARVLTGLILALAAFALLKYPQEISQSVLQGAQLCVTLLLPGLFPFFILSSLAVKLGFADLLGLLFKPLMGPLFHLPGNCACGLILGLLGGYPTGARTAAVLYREGLCSRQQAQRLLGFCNNCGPAFLLGTVGYGLFGELRYGLLLAGVHTGAACLTGMILNRCATDAFDTAESAPSKSVAALPAAFVSSVTESFQSLLNLFAFVLCFSAIAKLLLLSPLPAHFSALLAPFFVPENAEALFLGLFEMTLGVTAVQTGSIEERLILTSALLGWGGLCVHCQVLALLQDTDLSPASYFKGKALHALLSAFLMTALLLNSVGLCLVAGAATMLFPCRRKKQWKNRKRYSIMNSAR